MSTNHSEKNKFNVYLPLLFAFVLLAGMQLGFNLYKTLKGKPDTVYLNNQGIPQLDEVFNYIDARYVDDVKSEDLIEKVIQETLKDLDPHSNYISPKELKEVTESLQGNFEGIGVEFSIVKDTILVVTPISGGPSEQLGIQAGDKIIQIEDTLVAGIGITNKDVVSKLRGEKDTKVKVSIYRKGVKELIDYQIKRNKIPIVSVDVSYMVDKEIGYIKINRFSATTYDEFMKALYSLKESGMKKLMLDLRQNPGGYLNAAVNIADEFIDGRNLLVYTEGKKHKRKDYNARRKGFFETGDLVVLIDEGSASASEIISGAVQDWDRGKVLGRRSFGKGLVQEQYDLSNGAALRLTVARYYTPSGRCIQKPYEDGRAAYSNEINKRFEKGELTNEDSLKQITPDTLIFKTLIEGRTVSGGGGISPDIFVSLDTTKNETFAIRAKSLVTAFVYDYFSNNPGEFSSYSDFSNFTRNYKVNSKQFNSYKQFVEAELDTMNLDLINRDADEIKTYIKAQVARQKWKNEGFYPIIHQLDPTFKEALKQFQ